MERDSVRNKLDDLCWGLLRRIDKTGALPVNPFGPIFDQNNNVAVMLEHETKSNNMVYRPTWRKL